MKRVGIFTWILGWGIFSNARNIAKIKDNIHVLQKQNQLQDKQIKQLANYLNLTMHQVDRHSEMLYELDTKNDHYCCITFYRLTGILVTSLLNAIAKAWVIIEILQCYCIRKFLHFL